MATYRDLLARQRAQVSDGMLIHAARLRWSPERIFVERQRRLRNLLRYAIDRSPFFAERLWGVEPETFTLDDLPSLPVMTKDEMMASFDDALTDRELTLELANEHVERCYTTDGYLLDKYRVVATGGTSGRRGLFVYGWDDWVTLALMEQRSWMRHGLLPPPEKIASLYTDRPAHISGAISIFAGDAEHPIHRLPPTLPIDELIGRLNEIQPVLLQGYPTVLQALAGEAYAGRLKIHPERAKTTGEMLLPETRQAFRDLWDVEISEAYAMSEGLFSRDCDHGAIHLPDDLVIVEPVDEDGRAVAPGQLATKLYVTILYRMAQPLIRYEVTDSMVVHDETCACGSGHSWISDLSGRLEESFRYPGGAVLHAAAVQGRLMREPNLIEFQVRQTGTGIDVAVRASGPLDVVRLRSDLRETLVRSGVGDPDVTVWPADHLDRVWSGKLRRFVPLGLTTAGPRPVKDADPVAVRGLS